LKITLVFFFALNIKTLIFFMQQFQEIILDLENRRKRPE